MKNKLISHVILLILIASCEKVTTPLGTEDESIIIGKSEVNSMNTVIFDPPLELFSSPNGGGKEDSIDIFNDGIFEISFISFGQKWANTKYCAIESLNDSIEFLVEILNDTIFYTNDNQNTEIGGKKVIWNSNSGYNSFSNSDSLSKISQRHLTRMLYYGDIINPVDSNLVWKNSGIFNYYSEGFHYSSDYYNYFKYGFWNNNGENYFCFRIRNSNTMKYGWVKTSIFNTYNIKVYESYVQD